MLSSFYLVLKKQTLLIKKIVKIYFFLSFLKFLNLQPISYVIGSVTLVLSSQTPFCSCCFLSFYIKVFNFHVLVCHISPRQSLFHSLPCFLQSYAALILSPPVLVHVPLYEFLDTCPAIWVSWYMSRYMSFLIHAPLYKSLDTCSSIWVSWYMSRYMSFLIHAPLYEFLDTCPAVWVSW